MMNMAYPMQAPPPVMRPMPMQGMQAQAAGAYGAYRGYRGNWGGYKPQFFSLHYGRKKRKTGTCAECAI